MELIKYTKNIYPHSIPLSTCPHSLKSHFRYTIISPGSRLFKYDSDLSEFGIGVPVQADLPGAAPLPHRLHPPRRHLPPAHVPGPEGVRYHVGETQI